MKKLFCLLLILMLAALCACGRQADPEADLHLEPLAPVTPTAAPVEETPPVEETSPAVEDAPEDALDEEGYETALALIGHTRQELVAALGEPAQEQYAASCEEENAEDGMLFYQGFYIWTVRNTESERIHDVYLLD